MELESSESDSTAGIRRAVGLVRLTDGEEIARWFRKERGEWTAEEPASAAELESAPFLSPSLCDIHIHGAFGIDVMSATTKDLSRLDAKLREEGYGDWLATTVTCSAEDALRVLDALPDDDLELGSALRGVHLEGPFISSKHPGAQPQQYILAYRDAGAEWDAVLDHPNLRLITLAPEVPGNEELIQRLVARGVVVSLGHTDATYDEARLAVERGAAHVTHTYNAMRSLHHREPGLLGYAFSEDRLQPELIYDRLHVSPPAAKILFDAAGERAIAVSDGTMAAGLAPGTRLTMWGLDCIVGEGDVRLAANGGLAGSAVTLKTVFENLAEDFGRRVAVRLCDENPRSSFGWNSRPHALLWSAKNRSFGWA